MTMYAEGPESESVKIAVQREAARRKRSFLMYLLLLAVPIAIGGYAIANAPTQTQAVAKEVLPAVNANVQESIKPQVAEAVATQAEPIIRDTVERQINRNLDQAVAVRIKPEVARIEQLVVRSGGNGRVKELEDRVTALEKQVAALTQALQSRRPERPDVTRIPVNPKPQ